MEILNKLDIMESFNTDMPQQKLWNIFFKMNFTDKNSLKQVKIIKRISILFAIY